MPRSARSLVAAFAEKRILVIGDLMLDEFIWGKVSRISPEAPVPVVEVTGESYYPGGAANVARNVREFTPHVSVMGSVGCDAHGRQLLELLGSSGIDVSAVQQSPSISTTVKSRIIARNQQVVRVDRERKGALGSDHLEQAMRALDRAAAEVDAIIVADYISGKARETGAVLAVDPHPHTLLRWRGATAIKPNRAEAFIAAGLRPSDPVEPVLNDHALLDAGRRLLRNWETGSLLITLGEQGMLLLRADEEPRRLPARAKEVFDVSGAGDTAIAVFALALSAGAPPLDAAELANCASSIVVGKLGTATVTAAELERECGRL